MNDFLQRAMEGMSSRNPEVRVTSATEIHHIGRGLADHAVFPWWEDSELFSLLEGTNPFVTVGLAVTPERLEKIREACERLGTERLRPLKEALPEEITYEEIRLVAAWQKREKG